MLGLVTATILGFFGTASWFFDLMANLRLQLAVLLGSVTVMALIVRSWGIAAAALVAAAVNLGVVLPMMFPSPEPPVATGETLDVTFFNTKIVADRAATIDYLAGRNDDVVILAVTPHDWIDGLEGAGTGLHPVAGRHVTPGLEITVLARDPATEVIVHRASDYFRDWVVEISTELDGEPVSILGAHAVSPMTPRRAQHRDLVLDWIGAWADRRDAPVVVAGDLNATPWSTNFQATLEQGELTDSLETHGLQPSWPAGLGRLGIPIDHVLHSEELVVVDRQLGPSFGSDHRMVHARITRRAPGE